MKSRTLTFITATIVFAALAISSPAQTDCSVASPCFNSLFSFNGADGSSPNSVVQGLDGNFYGTTTYGGANCQAFGGCGTVFKITPTGTLTTLYSLCRETNSDGVCTDGSSPNAGLVQGTDGNLYGTTFGGGTNGGGTIFKITPNGALTTLYDFCSRANCADGERPSEGVVQGTDGNFYGTTSAGGQEPDQCSGLLPGIGCGTVFKITPAGRLTTLYSFCLKSTCTDGALPEAGLVEGSDGSFYGTTNFGGDEASQANCFIMDPFPPEYGCGTVFKITPAGRLKTLYSFCSTLEGSTCTDGAFPVATLVQGTDGNLYGTMFLGGTNGRGTIFKISPDGKLTTLYNFCSQANCADGGFPKAGLVQGTDGNFYGITEAGGGGTFCEFDGCGTVFKISPDGKLTTLYNFCSQANCADGEFPEAGLVQGTDGNFYGTTYEGGSNTGCYTGNGTCGTVFSLSVGLRPFVKTLPTSGKVGETVRILGTDLSNTTHVRFNHMEAEFKVISESEIQTSVPDGATTGFVTVNRRGPRLKSNVPFQVLP